MFKFSFFTDVHLRGVNPSSRKDEYSVSVLNKLDEIYRVSNENNVDFMIFGGDLFDSHKIYAYEVVSGFLTILWKYKIKTYFVVGQHDLFGYNKGTYGKSALNFVSKLSRDYFVPISRLTELEYCDLYSCHVYNDLAEKLVDVDDTPGRFKILTAHKLLDKGKQVFDVILTLSLPPNKFNLILSGDLHNGYEFHKEGSTYYYNSGAIARLKNNKSNRNRDIKFGIFEVSEKDGEFDICLTERKLESAIPIDKIFDLSKEDEDEDQYNDEEFEIDMDKFIEDFEKFEEESIEIFDLIQKVGKAEKIDNEILEYIQMFRGESDGSE